MKTMEFLIGTDIKKAAVDMVALAKQSGEEVHANFNDVLLVATSTSTAEDLQAFYRTTCEEQCKRYQASPEGIAAAERARAFREAAEVAAAEGILSFKIKDQDTWDQIVANNTDGYGACTVRYAARWANLMEQKLQQNCTLREIADQTSHEADVEGITGFMYGFAVKCLAKVWAHGEELRRWHNRATQLHDEGDRANDSGGVLNPACLTIG
jgi:hypothetical protein